MGLHTVFFVLGGLALGTSLYRAMRQQAHKPPSQAAAPRSEGPFPPTRSNGPDGGPAQEPGASLQRTADEIDKP